MIPLHKTFQKFSIQEAFAQKVELHRRILCFFSDPAYMAGFEKGFRAGESC